MEPNGVQYAESLQGVQGNGVPMNEGQSQAKPKGSFLRSLLSVVLTIAAIVAASYLLRTFVFQSYEIPSASMEETIMTGDLVIGEKVSYHFSEPQAGQIVTFDDPEIPSRTLIKRVIATEGQTINLVDGSVYIDGERQFESYTDGKPSYPLANSIANITYPYTVPSGHVWVMGDNRTNSQDSRYFGAIPVTSVSSRAAVIYWPIDNFRVLE